MSDEVKEIQEAVLADEEEILAELQGRTFDKEKFVYKTKDGGFQLSYKGVQVACREFAKRGEVIEIPELAKVMYDPEDKQYVLAQVLGRRVRLDPKSGNRVILDSAIGSKRKWLRQQRRNGESMADPFFFEKAISQAECSVKRKLLPQEFVMEFVKQILKGKAPQAAAGKPQEAKEATQEGRGARKGGSGAPAASQGKSDALGALRQQFWAVLKKATKAKDDASARKAVEALTGGSKVSALDEATLKKLGGFLRKVADGEAAIKRQGDKVVIFHGPTGDVLWPEGRQEAPKQEEGVPATTSNDPPGGGEWMF